jgi:Holliday junction resolvasome RuvABC endonuclease subunit
MNILPRKQETGQNGYVAKLFDIEFGKKEYPIPDSYTTFVGIDPGTRNMGIAIIHDRIGKAFDILIPKAPDRVASMLMIQECIGYILNGWQDGISKGRWIVAVEDAAFGMKFGQVPLAESRAAAMLFFASKTQNVQIVAPMRVRKAVFGNGKIKAHDVWEIAPNAGAALSLALFGQLMHTE